MEEVRHVKKEMMMKRRDGPQQEGDGKVLICLHIMLEYGHSGQLGYPEVPRDHLLRARQDQRCFHLRSNAYLGLAKLCSSLHDVLKGLFPGVLMGTGDHRAHTLWFIRSLMVGGGQVVCKAVAVLVQHKAEFRREAIVSLPRDLVQQHCLVVHQVCYIID